LPAETITKDFSNIALTEPHAVSAPLVSEAKSAEGVTTPNLPSEDTHAPPQAAAAAASSDPEVAENKKQDPPLEVTYAPPQIQSSEPEAMESSKISAEAVAHAPPPSEQPLPGGVEHPQAEETPVEVATPLASNPDILTSEATPGFEEIPMNETGA
jgi:hypothetical protein